MPITIKGIAALAGVSIGTVDRALHDRGRVNPELAGRIKEIAREHGFEPSRAGRALALKKNPVRIGVVAHLTKTEFMREALRGIGKAKEELESLGAEIRLVKIPSLDVDCQLAAVDELLEWGAQGIAITPAEDERLRVRIDEVAEEIPVVTFNTDMPGSRRVCFVGMDNRRSGETAAGLMALLTGGSGKIALITGHLTNRANSERVEGFLREIRIIAPRIVVTGIQACYDEDEVAAELVCRALDAAPDLSGIFMDAGGQAGLCHALDGRGRDRPKVIAYDVIPATISGLNRGVIDLVIDQNAFAQGYRSSMILFEYLFNKREAGQQYQYTDILIKTKYNL